MSLFGDSRGRHDLKQELVFVLKSSSVKGGRYVLASSANADGRAPRSQRVGL